MIDFDFFQAHPNKIAKLKGTGIIINNLQDAIDVLGNASYLQAKAVVIEEHQIASSFFNLKTGFAGDVLQKYSNYQMKLAIIGTFDKYNSKALDAFITECNRGSHIYFVTDMDTALGKLS